MEREPKTLQEAMAYFGVPANCRDYLSKRRWPNGVECPRCGSKNITFLEAYERWTCRDCKAAKKSPQFTLKTQTFMEDSPIPVGKWLLGMWLIGNCKNGISSCELAKDLGITQKSAWFMLHRIRSATSAAGSRQHGSRAHGLHGA